MWDRWNRILARLRRFERRELRELRRWLERTTNLVHLSVLCAVPLLIGVVTALSNAIGSFSYLLFPPLASGAYTLFANPGGEYASPVRFVGGLTAGAVCGWVAVALAARLLYPTAAGEIHAAGAALSVFLTGLVTWGLDLEEPAAFSTALLTLFVYARVDTPAYYVLSVAAGSGIVAGAFLGWRRFVYERRARYLYGSVSGDDHVLVPVQGETPDATLMLAARLAAAHRAGKVVLLDVVSDERAARAERSLLRERGDTRLIESARGRPAGDTGDGQAPGDGEHAESVTALEERARTVETRAGVPCEVVVVAGTGPLARTVVRTARETNCDLVAVPYETEHGTVTPFIRELFGADIDVLVHRSEDGRERWTRVLVPVREAGELAHSAVDFAIRLAGRAGQVSVGTCIGTERARRRAERMLADLVEPFEGTIETRVSGLAIEEFLGQHGGEYDLVIIGASQDRSAASRFISPPTFERIDGDEVGADIAIVDRR